MRQQLSLKPAHKVVQDFYKEIDNLSQLNLFHEGAVSPAFANLLKRCATQFGWTLSEQHMPKGGKTNLRFDGALLDEFKLVHGVWEAKDTRDELSVEAAKKFKAGYPKDNILFQSPQRAILYQNGQMVFDADIRKPEQLVGILELFFEFEPPAYEQWNEAVEEFKLRIREYGDSALAIIEQERRTNKRFVQAFNAFMEVCRAAINPNLSTQAVEEMLIQHLLTERLFRKVFNNPDFVRRNAIAAEIEKVIEALTSQSFSRAEFLKKLDRFYGAIEMTAETIDDFSEKQAFLNVVYEKFFQGFSVKVADTHGIVYTPQPIVDFMVRSVEEILKREFGRSLSDEGVHILDPFTGTGNFIVRTMREIRKSALPQKFGAELHCNEVMLLPYYIAAQNIEHAYYELTGQYQPFDGLCLVDTFQLAEGPQMAMSFVTAGNSERVKRQQEAPIFVILGNPPYNAHQVNENDNSKNRKYAVMDKRVSETYAKDSSATLTNKLADPYVKAFRWASDRIAQTGEGIVAYVSNNSFLEELTFDGMRENLEKDFDAVYTLNLTGNVRKNPKLSGTTHNVFGIQVGVNITFLVRRGQTSEVSTHKAHIFYARTGEEWRKEEKYDFLNSKGDYSAIDWQELIPDARHTWLTEGLQDDFETFLPMGSKEKEMAIFKTFSLGISTNRDSAVYDFNKQALEDRTEKFCDDYNSEVVRYQQKGRPKDIDSFVRTETVQWSSTLKNRLNGGVLAEFDKHKVKSSLFRPYTKMFLYYDNVLNDRPGHFKEIFPSAKAETENLVICMTDKGSEKPFMVMMSNQICDLHLVGSGCGTQCFPFYVYDEDGSNRRENISDWALEQFNEHYGRGGSRSAPTKPIEKWDIFYYVYALLHSLAYREKYAANLKRDLPHLPFIEELVELNPKGLPGVNGTQSGKDELPASSLPGTETFRVSDDRVSLFWKYVEAGRKLAELHVNYESQSEYPLEMVENPSARLDWRVEKMKLVKDPLPASPKFQEREFRGGATLIYNDFLTLKGIPAEAFEYRLGNRSALDWVIDQYRVTTDPRSKIVNDPNDSDDPQYIVRLIKKVVTVSVETVKVVKTL